MEDLLGSDEPEHLLMESSPSEEPGFVFSPITVQQKGNDMNNSGVKHPWGREAGQLRAWNMVWIHLLLWLLAAHNPSLFLSQQWYQHDIVDHSPQRPDFASG